MLTPHLGTPPSTLVQVRNLQRMQARTEVTTDRALIAAFKEIGKICAAMRLLDTVKKQAEEYYKQVGAKRPLMKFVPAVECQAHARPLLPQVSNPHPACAC